LWDVDAHEVSLLVPQGIYGRFSPDGQYLAFHTYTAASTSNEYDTQLHVLRLSDEQIILSLPSSERIIDYENVPGFVWSPTSNRLVYQDKQDNWQIIQISEGYQVPITLNGGGRLSFPQWSYDGQYLSVTVSSSITERGIVIFNVP
jgi:Tol biopolymer transport system component